MSITTGGIKVVLVDKNQMFVQAVEPLLSGLDGISVSGRGQNGDDAVFLCRVYQPHVLVIGTELEGPPLTLTLAMVHQYSPSTRVLVMATNSAAARVLETSSSQAWGYVSKESPLVELVESIRCAPLTGCRRIPNAPVLSSAPVAPHGGLISRREFQVLELIADGKSNTEIAQNLTISSGTAKRHVANLYAKLGVNSRVAAFGRGVSLGLLHSPGTDVREGVAPLIP